MSLHAASGANLGAEVHETIQQCDNSDTLGALRATRDECIEADFLAQVGDPILTSVIPFESGAPIELVPTLVFASACQSLSAMMVLAALLFGSLPQISIPGSPLLIHRDS